MKTPKIGYVQCLSPYGLHKTAYREWGNPNNPKVLICVHGVTRISNDFDEMAAALCDEYRVICPDIVGRGLSDWLPDPQLYRIPQYVSDMVCLIARSGAQKVDWFGTSMGGLIGIVMASMRESPVNKLILNDIGPALNFSALSRIGNYIGQELSFTSFEEGAEYIRSISAPFGPHSEAQWRKIAANVLKQKPDGTWTRHYDHSLALPFTSDSEDSARQAEAHLWMAYDAIQCPVMLVRGAQSDLLSEAVAREMTCRGPRASLAELPGIGHAPTFMHEEQIAIARQFLRV